MAGTRYGILNVVDLEATCGEEIPEENREIIEIGITQVDRTKLKIIKSESILVIPTESFVTPFCTALTGHTQERLEKDGISFEDACQRLREEFNSWKYGWIGHGNYDMLKFSSQCRKRGVRYPFSPSYMNSGMFFALLTGRGRGPGLKKMCQMMNVPMEGKHHSGKDDSYNTAVCLIKLLKLAQINPDKDFK